MDNKNNTKKKVIITILVLVLVVIGVLFALKGCQKEEPVVHNHSYKINEEGTWICLDDNDILSNTDKPYVAILENNQPKDILAIDSLSKTKINLGNGTIYKDGNNIYYSGNNAQTVIIKTQKVDDKQDDKDALVINAPNDTVYHYGSSTVISLDAVATNSFHEYGKVDLITLTKARVVLENKSDVKEIYLDINDSNYSYETTIIALKENVELPRLTRDAVDLEEGEVKTLAIVQRLKDEVKTETNTETNEVIETVLEVQAAEDDYVKIENVRKSNDELIIEAFLSPNADESDKTQTQTQSTSTITLEEAKEGSNHPASHNTFVPKEKKVTEVVKPTETAKEEPKVEETKPVVTPTKKEEVKPVVTPTTEDDTPSTPSTPTHSHSYGNWYDLDASYHAKKCSCGDTVKEEHVLDTKGVCQKCGHNAVARIGSTYFATLDDAIDASVVNDIVYLEKDVDCAVTVPTGKNFILDLNEHTVNGQQVANTPALTNNGIIAIKNGTIKRNDTQDSSNWYYTIVNNGTMTFEEGATVVNNSGVLNCSSGASLIRNLGIMTVNAGTFTQERYQVFRNGCDDGTNTKTDAVLTIHSGYIDGAYAFQNHEKMYVDGGDIHGTTVYDVTGSEPCETYISGGYFSHPSTGAGHYTLTGGFVKSLKPAEGYHLSYVADENGYYEVLPGAVKNIYINTTPVSKFATIQEAFDYAVANNITYAVQVEDDASESIVVESGEMLKVTFNDADKEFSMNLSITIKAGGTMNLKARLTDIIESSDLLNATYTPTTPNTSVENHPHYYYNGKDFIALKDVVVTITNGGHYRVDYASGSHSDFNYYSVKVSAANN